MEKINVAELLKDCPSGMELDCTMYDDVEFMEVDTDRDDNIILRVGKKFIRRLNKYGTEDNIDYVKCVIFPKGKTTWEGFVPPCKFKVGDIVVDDTGAIFLYKQIHTYYEEPYADFYCGLTSRFRSFVIKTEEAQRCGKISSIRFATEEEKEKLFQAIKDNGYRWNEETKALEKLVEPKFKVGDKIRHKTTNKNDIYEISKVYDDSYGLVGFTWMIYMKYQDQYELVPNKFDISTLVPFESRVLMRSSNAGEWTGTIFSHYSNNKFYGCGMCCDQCIPYEGNEHLLGKTDDCNKYFKTWK